MNISYYAALGKQPISLAQPTGKEIREEDEFNLLQTEISKMSNPTAANGVDWEQVVQLAASLTATKGKDMLVACYLVGGLLQTRGLPGLMAGIELLDDMTALYWETIYPLPVRARARRNALQWLLDRIKVHGEQSDWSTLPPQVPELIANLQTRLTSLDILLADKDAEAPSLRGVLLQLANVALQQVAPPLLAAAVESGPPAALSNTVMGAVGAWQAPLAEQSNAAIGSVEAAQQICDAALERLDNMADYLGDGDLTEPSGYRFKRLAAWAGIARSPPEDGGVTMLPGPIFQVQEVLRNLLSHQADEDLLRFTEANVVSYPFWLDLNCIAAQALGRMGEPHAAALREVCAATAWLLIRFPTIGQLTFASGMPFANGATLQWLTTLISGANAGTPVKDTIAATMGHARAQATANNLAGAVRSVQTAIEQSATPAHRLQLRVHLCELLLVERPGAHLQPLAQALIEDIDNVRLPQWDPALALAGLLAAYKILISNDDMQRQSDALLVRIAALDAAAMVALVT